MKSIITVSELHKTYDMDDDVRVVALDNVSLEIEEGALVTTMGPSGSGKSTLMHIVGGLDRPTSGSVQVGKYNVTSLDEQQMAVYRRQTIGFIFQSFNLIQSMTALENVALPLRLSGIPRSERLEYAYELLTKVGLQDRVYHKPTQLSGGQQQRIAIARALANDPPVILADEPTGNLDTASGENVMEMLRELNENGRTIMVVTHDPRMTKYASRVIKMLDGHLL
ncbi:MAG: ABC transporter ATP-binding protein [Chloroflexi bacterium]|jgi:putative ABC transport system ATP-binding protein|nr:ABC transporter ATP-binding protein [Chloroflexota bacterium]